MRVSWCSTVEVDFHFFIILKNGNFRYLNRYFCGWFFWVECKIYARQCLWSWLCSAKLKFCPIFHFLGVMLSKNGAKWDQIMFNFVRKAIKSEKNWFEYFFFTKLFSSVFPSIIFEIMISSGPSLTIVVNCCPCWTSEVGSQLLQRKLMIFFEIGVRQWLCHSVRFIFS